MATEIEEYKGEVFAVAQLQVYGMQVWAKLKSPNGAQPTIDQFCMKEVVQITAETFGLCFPGHALIRHFMLTITDATSRFKESWRQQNVPCIIGSVDATYKRFTATGAMATSVFQVRQTVWSNDVNAPVISINLTTASLDDPALVAACDAYNQVVNVTGMAPISIMYLDCPNRDAGGAIRRFPSLNTGATTELTLPLTRCNAVNTVEQLSAALEALSNTKVVALDLEWTAAQRAQESPGKVALLQLYPVGSGVDQDGGSCVVVSLAAIGDFPAMLATFLASKQLAGVNISADLTKLHKDFPVTLCILHKNLVELTSLAVDKLRCTLSAVKSLKALFERCCPTKTLNKNLCHEQGVRFVDWNRWPLSTNELQYAANDVYAHALIARRLLHPSPVVPHPPTISVAPQIPASASTLAPAVRAGVPAARAPVSEGSIGSCVPPHYAGLAESRQAPNLVVVSTYAADGTASFDQLTKEMRAEVLPSTSDIVDDVEDSPDVDSLLDSSVPDVDSLLDSSVTTVAAKKTVLQAAADLIDAYSFSSVSEPLVLPTFLTPSDRAALHDRCESLGLLHVSIESEGSRQLEVRKSSLPISAGQVDRSSFLLSSDSDARILSQLNFNSEWQIGSIKYDPRHFMGNFFLLAQSKSSPLFKFFCTAVSDAIFKMQDGERARVEAHLRKLFREKPRDPTDVLRVNTLVLRVKRSYWRSYACFSILGPQVVVRDLLAVYNFFKTLLCPESGRPFFASDHDKRIVLELSYVANGYLSDHPTIALYIPLRKLATGLQIFHCLRTSSPQEGYHQHLNNAVVACGKHAGLRYTDAVTNEFDWRWVIKALRKAGVLPKWFRHFNVALIEEIYDLVGKLFSSDAVALHLPGWRRTKLMTVPLLHQGIYYTLDSLRKMLSPQAPAVDLKLAAAISEGDFLSQCLGTEQPIRFNRTAADTEVLLAAFQADPATVASVSFARGLLLSPAEASSFGEVVLLDEKARLTMVDAGYKTLQEQIRSNAPKRAIATLPALGSHSAGTLALPGPQITMSPMERDLAIRPLQQAAPTTTVEHADHPAVVADHTATQPVVIDPAADKERKRKREAAQERRKNPGKLCYCLDLKVAFSKSVFFL